MMLIEEITVPDAALPVEDFKAHLRLGTSFGQQTVQDEVLTGFHLRLGTSFGQQTVQDEVLTGFLRAAMAAIEARTGKILLIRTFSWSVSHWRNSDAQGLPVAPVVQVTRVAIVSRDGFEAAVPPEAYWLERDDMRPRLRSRGGTLSSIPHGGTAILQFEAGYAANWAGLPADLKQAVLLLASHYYEYRHETSLSDGCMPFGVSSLIERYKSMRIGMGGLR